MVKTIIVALTAIVLGVLVFYWERHIEWVTFGPGPVTQAAALDIHQFVEGRHAPVQTQLRAMAPAPYVNASVPSPEHSAARAQQFAWQMYARSARQKYAILFRSLHLSTARQGQLQALLIEREQCLGAPFYDTRSNEAEVEASLQANADALADVDKRIEALLDAEDVETYRLLKESSYEQDQLSYFYHSLDNDPVVETAKLPLLLTKMRFKYQVDTELDGINDALENTRPINRPFMVQQYHQQLLNALDHYIDTAKEWLNDQQLQLLERDERTRLEAYWQQLSAAWNIPAAH